MKGKRKERGMKEGMKETNNIIVERNRKEIRKERREG